MIKKYEVRRGRYVYDRYNCLDDLMNGIFDVDYYRDNNEDMLRERINDCNDGFEYGGRQWSATEVLSALEELDDYLNDEAQCDVDNLRDEYEYQIENLHNDGDCVTIDELDYDVYCVEEIPESEEDAEELGIMTEEAVDELHDLLCA
jgi:hypothetical protein